MRRLAVLGLTLMVFLSLAATASALTVYTDKAAWANALSGQFLTEDFTDADLNTGVSFVSTESGNINTQFGYYHDVLNSDSQNEPMTTWSFTPQITAYGGNWDLGGPGGGGNNLLVYVKVGDIDQYVRFISNSYEGEFWGFTSDTPFTSVILKGGTGDHQQIYKLDNMVYAPVPVPGTVWLLGGGLLGLLARLRRVS